MLKIKSFLSKTVTLIILLAAASNLMANSYTTKAKNAGKCVLKTGWTAAKTATIVYCIKQAHYFHAAPQLEQQFNKSPLGSIYI